MTPEGMQHTGGEKQHDLAGAAIEKVHAEMKETEKRNNIARYPEVRAEISRLSATLERGEKLGLGTDADSEKEKEMGTQLGLLAEERRKLEEYFEENDIKPEEYRGTIQ